MQGSRPARCGRRLSKPRPKRPLSHPNRDQASHARQRSDYGDHETEAQEADEVDELSTEALAWQLLLLVNPGGEETALRQFSAYQEAAATAGDGVEPVWLLKDAIDWTSGFFVDWKDSETFIDAVTELVRRWNLEIDWGAIRRTRIPRSHRYPALMSHAYDGLRERGYTLWTGTRGATSGGVVDTSSRDDEAMGWWRWR